MSRLFSNLKEQKPKTQHKDTRIEIAQDFDRLKSESIAYFALMKRVSDLRDEAHIQVMYLAGEPIGSQWKAKLNAYDEVLSIPENYARKAIEANEEVNIKSIV